MTRTYPSAADIPGGWTNYEVKAGDLVRQAVHYTSRFRYPAGSTARVIAVRDRSILTVEYLSDPPESDVEKTLRVWKNHFEPV